MLSCVAYKFAIFIFSSMLKTPITLYFALICMRIVLWYHKMWQHCCRGRHTMLYTRLHSLSRWEVWQAWRPKWKRNFHLFYTHNVIIFYYNFKLLSQWVVLRIAVSEQKNTNGHKNSLNPIIIWKYHKSSFDVGKRVKLHVLSLYGHF